MGNIYIAPSKLIQLKKIPASELIINKDGSIYHLGLRPENIAKDIITVGDPKRAKFISSYFDKTTVVKKNREFHSYTGTIGNKRLTVISTGIGTDNIDIVFTELDALVNINLSKRTLKKKSTSLRFYRMGTSGCIQKDIPIDSFLVSHKAIGLDGLLNFYNLKTSKKDQSILDEFNALIKTPHIHPYISSGDKDLIKKFKSEKSFLHGITITANGFYNPQGRSIRLQSKFSNSLQKVFNKKLGALPLSNLEMETAGIYGMSKLLGHKAISINALLANRANGHFSKQPQRTIKKLIEKSLEIISS